MVQSNPGTNPGTRGTLFRRKKKEVKQYTINNKLDNTRMSPKTISIQKADEKERSGVASNSKNKTVRKTGVSKKTFDES